MNPRRSRLDGVADDFTRFCEASSPSLLRAAFLLLGDWPSAEDALQTTLMRTFLHWRRAEANAPAYSRTVLLNLCRDIGRRRGRFHEAIAPLPEDVGTLTTDLFAEVDQRAVFAVALRSLSADQRELIVLRYFLDLSVSAAAKQLGIAEGTVKSSTSRALAKLRRSLADAKEQERC